MDTTLEELLELGRQLDAAMKDALAELAEIDAEIDRPKALLNNKETP